MLLTVKKQIEETIEVKTPAYYKDTSGYCFISESGQLVIVRQPMMIYMWDESYNMTYRSEVERIVNQCTPCEKADFDKAYAEAKAGLDIAAGAVEF